MNKKDQIIENIVSSFTPEQLKMLEINIRGKIIGFKRQLEAHYANKEAAPFSIQDANEIIQHIIKTHQPLFNLDPSLCIDRILVDRLDILFVPEERSGGWFQKRRINY